SCAAGGRRGSGGGAPVEREGGAGGDGAAERGGLVAQAALAALHALAVAFDGVEAEIAEHAAGAADAELVCEPAGGAAGDIGDGVLGHAGGALDTAGNAADDAGAEAFEFVHQLVRELAEAAEQYAFDQRQRAPVRDDVVDGVARGGEGLLDLVPRAGEECLDRLPILVDKKGGAGR